MALKIKRGDTVQVISGKESGELFSDDEQKRGRRGEVKKVIPKKNRIVVEGLNTRRRHARPSQNNQQGLFDFDAPMHISSVMLVDPNCGQPTRVGYRFTDSGEKVRVCKRCGKDIDG